ncbi:hypothetical protein CBER1_10711 [Cercospora berteroae]|uniref:F-box domain-containing protein n=1 Tax=Cercospora berteroae TaxID=357750 RepID=A0A2S6BYC7_9PEZI|nr:hypothetical protein CBER1_10711 [Cercospora berteroae]
MGRNTSPAPPEDTQAAPVFNLPPELVHAIFERLKQADVLLQARLACRLFAQIGLDHMLNTVSIVYKRDQFERLGKIAGHPMAKGVHTRNILDGYSTWEILNIPAIATNRGSLRHADQEQLRQAYSAYVATVRDQDNTANSEEDLSYLTTFFTGCDKLDNFTLALCEGVNGLIVPNPKAFQDTIVLPFGDFTVLDQEVDQFWTVAKALWKSGRAVKHFTAAHVSHRILSPAWRDEPTDNIIEHLMSGLREFRIELTCRGDVDHHPEAEVDIQLHHGQGLLAQWLSSGQELRVIKIRKYAPKHQYPAPDLQNAFGIETWPKLRELGLSDFSATEDDLVDLLLRHAKYLRRLSLSDIELLEGSWESTFRRIAGQLTKLKKVRLRGLLRDPEDDLAMDDMDYDGTRIDEWRDDIEGYLLYGGEMPDLSETARMGLDDSLIEDAPDDKKPGRMDDEAAGHATDGSAISYGSDALDRKI